MAFRAVLELEGALCGALDPGIGFCGGNHTVDREDVVELARPLYAAAYSGSISIARSKCSVALSRDSWLGRL